MNSIVADTLVTVGAKPIVWSPVTVATWRVADRDGKSRRVRIMQAPVVKCLVRKRG